MPNRNVELTDHFDQFLDARVASGRFGDANEAMGEALRLLEEREREDEAKLEWLRVAAAEGFDAIDRGDFVTLNSDEELTSFLQGIHDEVLAEQAERKSA